MERVYAGPPMVEVRGWDPLGVAVLVLAGGPALFCQWVVTAAAERQVVDVGAVAFAVGRAVMDFRVIARDVAPGVRTPAVFDMYVPIVRPRRDGRPGGSNPAGGTGQRWFLPPAARGSHRLFTGYETRPRCGRGGRLVCDQGASDPRGTATSDVGLAPRPARLVAAVDRSHAEATRRCDAQSGA